MGRLVTSRRLMVPERADGDVRVPRTDGVKCPKVNAPQGVWEDGICGVNLRGGLLRDGYSSLERLTMRDLTRSMNSPTAMPSMREPSRLRSETVSFSSSRSPTTSM